MQYGYNRIMIVTAISMVATVLVLQLLGAWAILCLVILPKDKK